MAFLTLLINFFLSFFLTKIIIKPFKKLFPDKPNNRSAHKTIKARGGGLAFISANLISSNFFYQTDFSFLIPLSIVCFFDDFKSISKLLRFFTQFSTSFYIILSSASYEIIRDNTNQNTSIILLFLLAVISTGIINFCNFIDGIDGLLTSLIIIFLFSSISFSTGSVYGIIGALAGFLIWNWNPSKIFMGDIGSNFLGGVVVWSLLNTKNINGSLGLFLVLSPLIFDCLICLFRRILKKHNIFEAHSSHLYQRLVKGGMSHSKVVIIYSMISLMISISYFAGGLKIALIITAINLLITFLIERKFAINFT